MFAKSEESLGSSSGIGSIKNESNEENSPRLIPTQFNCENRTGKDKCIWYCGNFCIPMLLIIAQNNENFVFCFTDKARKIKTANKQIQKLRTHLRQYRIDYHDAQLCE